MPIRATLLVIAVLLAAPSLAEERPPIVITDPSANRYRAAVQEFARLGSAGDSARELREAIGRGLEFSGLFDRIQDAAFLSPVVSQPLHTDQPVVCPNWAQIGADALVQGEIEERTSDLRVEFRVLDVARGCLSQLRKRYRGTREDLDRLGKAIADDVVGAFTGARGVSDTEIAFVSNRQRKQGGLGDGRGRGPPPRRHRQPLHQLLPQLVAQRRGHPLHVVPLPPSASHLHADPRGVGRQVASCAHSTPASLLPRGVLARWRGGRPGHEPGRCRGDLRRGSRRERPAPSHPEPGHRRLAHVVPGRQAPGLRLGPGRRAPGLRDEPGRQRRATADLPGRLQHGAGLVSRRALDRLREPGRRPAGHLADRSGGAGERPARHPPPWRREPQLVSRRPDRGFQLHPAGTGRPVRGGRERRESAAAHPGWGRRHVPTWGPYRR